MTLVKAKSPAFLFQDELTSAEMNTVQNEYIKALDGYGGGSYTLHDQLIIDGSNITFNTAFVAGSDFFAANNLTVSLSLFELNSNAMFYSDVGISGHLAVGGSSSLDATTISGAAIFNSTSVFNGAITLHEQLTTDDLIVAQSISVIDLDVATLANFHGDIGLGDYDGNTLNIYATTLINDSTLSWVGVGRELRTGQTLPNSNSSIDIAQFRTLYIPSSVTSTRTYTLSCTDVANGDFFSIQNDDDNSHIISGIVSTTIESGSGRAYQRISGTWRAVMVWDYLT